MSPGGMHAKWILVGADQTIVVTLRTYVKVLRWGNRTLPLFTAFDSIVDGCQHALTKGSILTDMAAKKSSRRLEKLDTCPVFLN